MRLQAYDRLIAKLQHFADTLNQRKLDKEVLSIISDDKSLRAELHTEIFIYEQIIEEYYEDFNDIICRDL